MPAGSDQLRRGNEAAALKGKTVNAELHAEWTEEPPFELDIDLVSGGVLVLEKNTKPANRLPDSYEDWILSMDERRALDEITFADFVATLNEMGRAR